MSDFTPKHLTDAINKIVPPKRMLLDLIFKRTEQSFEETIEYEVKATKRGLAQFVANGQAARVVDADGLIRKTVKIPAIREKSNISAAGILTTTAGGPSTGGPAPKQRFEMEIAKRQIKLKDRIYRRMEWMAAMALRGGMTITQDNVQFTIDFGLAASHKPVLTGQKLWGSGSASVDIIGDLDAYANLVASESGFTPDLLILGETAAKHFKTDEKVLKSLDSRNYAIGSLDASFTAVRIGNFGGLEVYKHNETYVDEQGATQYMVPKNAAILVASGAPFKRYFGAIADEEAGLQAVEIFSKQYSVPDPSGRWVLAASSPLLVPGDPDAIVYATVCA